MMREPDILSEKQSQRLQKLLSKQEKATAQKQPGDTSSDSDEEGNMGHSKKSSNSWSALTFDGGNSSVSSCNGYQTHLRMSDWDEIKNFVDSMDEDDMLDVQDNVYTPRHRDPFSVVPGSPEEEYFIKIRDPQEHSHSGNTETTRSLSIGSSNHTTSSSIGDQGLYESIYFEEDAGLDESYFLDTPCAKKLPPRTRPSKAVRLPAFHPSISVVDKSMDLNDVFCEKDEDELCTGPNGSVEC